MALPAALILSDLTDELFLNDDAFLPRPVMNQIQLLEIPKDYKPPNFVPKVRIPQQFRYSKSYLEQLRSRPGNVKIFHLTSSLVHEQHKDTTDDELNFKSIFCGTALSPDFLTRHAPKRTSIRDNGPDLSVIDLQCKAKNVATMDDPTEEHDQICTAIGYCRDEVCFPNKPYPSRDRIEAFYKFVNNVYDNRNKIEAEQSESKISRVRQSSRKSTALTMDLDRYLDWLSSQYDDIKVQPYGHGNRLKSAEENNREWDVTFKDLDEWCQSCVLSGGLTFHFPAEDSFDLEDDVFDDFINDNDAQMDVEENKKCVYGAIGSKGCVPTTAIEELSADNAVNLSQDLWDELYTSIQEIREQVTMNYNLENCQHMNKKIQALTTIFED